MVTKRFATTGPWWIADKPGDTVRGTLEFDSGSSATVRLEPSINAQFIPILQGRTDDGEYTLLSCRLQTQSLFGDGENAYRADALVEGSIRPPQYFDAVPVARATVRAMTHNLATEPWSLSWETEKNAVVKIETEQRLFAVDAMNLSARVSADLATPIDVQSSRVLRVEPTVSLTVRPHSPQPVAYFERAFGEIAAFSSLMTGRVQTIAQIELGTDNDFDDADGPLHYTRPTSRLTDADDQVTSGSLYDDLNKQGLLPGVLGRWLETFETHALAVGHLFHCWNRGGPLLESRFMSAMQGLEIFHRRSQLKQTFIEPPQYETVRSAIVASIPAGVEASLRSALKKRLEFGNELSQRRRLQDLIKSLPTPTILKGITDDANEWVQRVADLRNEHVHGTRAHSPQDRRQMLRHLVGLSYLLHILILADLGVPATLFSRVQLMEPYIGFFLFPR